MKHLELHIIQPVPVSCLNRDDLGSPKTAVIGGTQRARVSSQCWKRAIREFAIEELPERFQGKRSNLLTNSLQEEAMAQGINEKDAQDIAIGIADAIAGVNKKAGEDHLKTTTLTFLAEPEVKRFVTKAIEDKILENIINNDTIKKDKVKDKIKTWIKKCHIDKGALVDSADIALFGRMCANIPDITLEAAANFSHAFSTHKASNELDFFTASADFASNEEKPNASMLGNTEFNSAVYYRFCSINLDLLKSDSHLGQLSDDELKEVVAAFIRATLMAIPNARKATMNANSLPSCVLGVVRESGHPIQLSNAFSTAINGQDIANESVQKLKEEYEKLSSTWGLEAVAEAWLPELSLSDFSKEIVKHV